MEELAQYQKHGIPATNMRLTRAMLIDQLKGFGSTIGKDYEDFKSRMQELVVWRTLGGLDTLAVLPTGAGKSLCFQLPAYCSAGTGQLTLVISPLRALMTMFADLSTTFAVFHSDIAVEKNQETWEHLSTGAKYVLLVGPEKLAQYNFQKKLCQQMKRHELRFARFVVDEVHCLSDWGHDFRPHYWWVAHHLRTVEKAMHVERAIPRLLLTATADKQVIRDIAQHFPEVEEPRNHVRAPVEREELFLCARKVNSLTNRKKALIKFLGRQATRRLPKAVKRRGIVYNRLAVREEDSEDDGKNSLRKDGYLSTNAVVKFLREKGFKRTFPFATGGVSKKERELALCKFDHAMAQKGRGRLTVIVATNAFGMGMDYAKVPFVCHLYPRTSLSEYWQEVGRAGRDMNLKTEWAETLAVFTDKDATILGRFAKAPAIDGLVNVYTMPVHHRMYVWPRGSNGMYLQGRGGGETAFSRLIRELQRTGVVDTQRNQRNGISNAVYYNVHIRKLRDKRQLMERLEREFSQKYLRKVFRYFRITADSRKRKWITLDQTSWKKDKATTVLQRLNRWVDIGSLKLDPTCQKFGVLRLRNVGKNLTNKSLKAIKRKGSGWAKHKRVQLKKALAALEESTPERRKEKVLATFWRSRKVPPFPHIVPKWMKRLGA